MRVQVKASSCPSYRGEYRFWLRKAQNASYTVADADIIALVAIDIRRVYFVTTKELTSVTLRKALHEYSPFVEAETWHRSINAVIGSQWSE